jgi:hypothetical protein
VSWLYRALVTVLLIEITASSVVIVSYSAPRGILVVTAAWALTASALAVSIALERYRVKG